MSKPWTFTEDKFLAAYYHPGSPDCMTGRTGSACTARARFLKSLGLWEDLKAAASLDECYSAIIEEARENRRRAA